MRKRNMRATRARMHASTRSRASQYTQLDAGTHGRRRRGAAVARRYAPLLARLGSRAELTDLLEEMFSEVGSSHMYVYGRCLPYLTHARPPTRVLGIT